MPPVPPREPGTRYYGGFISLPRGMNAGLDPSLIGTDQYASAVNMTVRGDLAYTRPPWLNHPFTMDETTAGRFTGKFQGSLEYDGEVSGQNCNLIWRGGKLFRLTLGVTNVLTEITPKILISTTADFIVPAPAASVLVEVVSESAIATGDTVFIDSGQYTVTNRAANELTLEYVGGAAGSPVPSGTAVLDSNMVQISEFRPFPDTLEFVHIIQAENYAISFGGQHRTVAFDGSMARQLGVQELPPGLLGAYGWGRVWICLNDRRSFVAGDIAYGNGQRSNILNFTENDFLNEGGTFTVPHNSGPITGMQFLQAQDTSLGQGVLLVGTTNSVISVNAPVDRTIWKNLRYPIQTIAVLDYGPLSPRATIPTNSDMWYRSLDGWRSFITAHRYFTTPGNTPLSREIDPLLAFDTAFLLFFGSGILFDNRMMQTFSPTRTEDGIVHRGLISLNLDLVSTISEKQPPAYEGAFTGLDIFQILKGKPDGQDSAERAFMWVNNDGVFEFWEVQKEGYYDTYTVGEPGAQTVTRTPIESWMITRSDDFKIPFDRKKLRMAELYLDEIVDTVTVQVQFKPDQLARWIDWGDSFTVCANVSQCELPPNCAVFAPKNPGYKTRITLGQPPETCSDVDVPVNLGYEFQCKIKLTGHARLKQFRTHAMIDPTPMDGGNVCEASTCKTLTGCGEYFFDYNVR